MIDERTFIFDVQSVIHWMSAIFFHINILNNNYLQMGHHTRLLDV